MMFVPRAVKRKPPPKPIAKRPATKTPDIDIKSTDQKSTHDEIQPACTSNLQQSKPTTTGSSSQKRSSSHVIPSQETSPSHVIPSQETSSSHVMPSQETSLSHVIPSQEISSLHVITSQERSSSHVIPSQERSSSHVIPSLQSQIDLCTDITSNQTDSRTVGVDLPTTVNAPQELNITISQGQHSEANNKSDFNRTTTSVIKPVDDDGQFDTKPGDDGAEGVVKQDSVKMEEDAIEKETEEMEEEAPVISFSKNQRWPVAGSDEPVCVVCGRYGEYICSRTDMDVCSLECKARNLARNIKQHSIPASNLLMELTGIPGSVPPSKVPSDQGGESAQQQKIEEKPTELNGYTYEEHEDIEDLDGEEVQELRAQVEIFVEGVDIPRPVPEFQHLNLPKTVKINLDTVGYHNPTPVQMQVIPTALYGRDTMVCAQTSSGKTASFLIPTILHMYNAVCRSPQTTEHKDPLALILAPTRELAMQIEEQAKQLMKGLPNMKTALLVGGLPLPPQLHRLRQGIQLIIATPGRLLEVIQKKGVSFESVKVLIIDEFDSMLQMGFHDQVMDIVIHLPEPHQTMLFSATIPKAREQMASSLLHNPVYISVGTPSTPCTSVKQVVMWIEEPSKKKKLFALLQDHKHYRPPIVVFVDSKMGADLLAESIEKICGISAVSLHGDKRQTERTEILQHFLAGDHPVIVCTSILGRGIDLPGVTMVVNFDMPSSVEEYIHQIGRTGRLGSKGTAITFINNGAKHLFLEFVNTLKPLGIQLPIQLANSQHLHNQKQRHQARNVQQEKTKKGPITGYLARKRKDQTNWDNVGDLLAKRKRKHKR